MDNPNIGTDDTFVRVFDAPDQATAELVCAVLLSAGIRARGQELYVFATTSLLPHLPITDSRGVFVPASDVEAARALLATQEPTEEELAAEVEADELTLEEAEARVK